MRKDKQRSLIMVLQRCRGDLIEAQCRTNDIRYCDTVESIDIAIRLLERQRQHNSGNRMLKVV